MGQPKQLLSYRGQTLLRRMAEVALALPLHEVWVVLGAQAKQMYPSLEGLPVPIVENHDWQHGMGSSLAQLGEQTDALLVMLVDQPYVTPVLLERIMAAYQHGAPLVAARYSDTLGVPALFDRSFFPQLAQFPPQKGMRALLQAEKARVLAIPFP